MKIPLKVYLLVIRAKLKFMKPLKNQKRITEKAQDSEYYQLFLAYKDLMDQQIAFQK